MSNEIALFANMPAEYKELLAQLEPDTTISTSGGVRRLSIRGGVFRQVVGGQEIAELDSRAINVVIVKTAELSRMFYAGQYVAGQSSAPTCWSANTKTGRPADEVPAEDRQASACFECPQNVKGSGMGESRACRFQQRLALLLADADGTIRSNEVYQLSLPATSIFGDDKKKPGLQTYAKLINSQGVPLSAVVTEMRFDTDSSTPKLCFKPVRALTQDELQMAVSAQKDPETVKLVTMTVNPKGGGNSGSDSAKVASLPPAKTQPVEEPEDGDIEEPTVKQSKKKVEPSPQADLASLLDEFDD